MSRVILLHEDVGISSCRADSTLEFRLKGMAAKAVEGLVKTMRQRTSSRRGGSTLGPRLKGVAAKGAYCLAKTVYWRVSEFKAFLPYLDARQQDSMKLDAGFHQKSWNP